MDNVDRDKPIEVDEEMDNMPVPQNSDEKTFSDFVAKHKDLIYKITKSNTKKDESGLTVIPENDVWRD